MPLAQRPDSSKRLAMLLSVAIAAAGCSIAPPRNVHPGALGAEPAFRAIAPAQADPERAANAIARAPASTGRAADAIEAKPPPTGSPAPPPAVASRVASPPASTLPAAARNEAFDIVWRTIQERYYDPALNGVDWDRVAARHRPRIAAAADDQAFWRALKRMAAELRDAHTRVHDPRQARERRREESTSVGIRFDFVGDAVVVAAVDADAGQGAPAAQPGDVVVAIEGVPTAEAWSSWRAAMGETSTERANRWRWLRDVIGGGTAGSALHLSILRGGSRFEVALVRRTVSTALRVQARRLASGAGYVAFNRIRSPLAVRLREAIAALGDIDGLVLDLRSNMGGTVAELRETVDGFVPGRTRFVRPYTRASAHPAPARAADWTSGRGALRSLGPLAVIVDARTASAAELLAAALQEHAGAVVVGRASCGCVLGIRRYEPLPGGAELAVSEIGFLDSDNRPLEGIGVVPDIVVEPTLDDLRAGRDPALEEAERLLRGAQSPRRRPLLDTEGAPLP